jgi:hypothetical protein
MAVDRPEHGGGDSAKHVRGRGGLPGGAGSIPRKNWLVSLLSTDRTDQIYRHHRHWTARGQNHGRTGELL